MRRHLYLKIQDRQTALESFIRQFHIQPQKEMIHVEDSLGRITYEAIFAKYSSPSYNSCAMDGIAVISSHTIDASENNPVILEYEKDYIEVDTGDMIQQPYDAVIMAEDLIECEQGYKIISATHPFAHVRAVGEDIVASEMVLPSFHKIQAIDISVLLSAGIKEIPVIQKPRIAIIPTGDEMIDYHDCLVDGKIIETNSYMFENLIKEHHGEAIRYPIIQDDYQLIKKTLKDASEKCDVIIINAGSSAGRDDYTADVILELGEIYTHGVSIKPGKPVILGKIGNKPVIGLPGYPVSSYITFMEFVVPIMHLYTQQEYQEYPLMKAKISKTVMSSLKYEEYVRVKLGIVDGQMIATPLPRGAGASMSLVKSDGFCIIPQDHEGVLAHEDINVRLMKDINDIRKTLVVIGSHDLILDVIDNVMHEKKEGVHLSSTHVGSLSGLIALRKKEAHITPTHILDEETGIYNIPIIQDMFKDENMVIIKGVRRRQGFIVQKGNPMHIHSIEDLKRVRYINRQKGAGTRILLDSLLKKEHIQSLDINGYDHVVTTHMSVAVAVKNGDADTGMGVYSSAKALNLDFVDIAYEEYDFVTYEKFLDLPYVQSFIRILKDESFLRKLDELGGYSYENIGEIIVVKNRGSNDE